MIDLGRKYKDTITGFEGVATGLASYISGCSQVLLAPPVTPDGAMRDAQWFDEQRLVAQGEDVIILNNAATPGCDKSAPKR
jgi:hypothetical protein